MKTPEHSYALVLAGVDVDLFTDVAVDLMRGRHLRHYHVMR